MNQLISNVLGIRVDGGDLLIDPVLPDELDGTRFEFDYGGPVTFIYRVKGSVVESVTINGHKVEAERISNPYRTGGLRISRAEFDKLRENGKAIVEIEM